MELTHVPSTQPYCWSFAVLQIPPVDVWQISCPCVGSRIHNSFQQFEWVFGCLFHVLLFLHKSTQWSLTGVQVSNHQISDCKCLVRKKRNIFGQVVAWTAGLGGNYEFNDTSHITVTKGDSEYLDPFCKSLFYYRSWFRISVHLFLIWKMKNNYLLLSSPLAPRL